MMRTALVLCLFVVAHWQCAFAATKRILLVGDSWMAGTWLSKAGDRALSAHGLGEYETEGAETAIGGSRADQWAANHQGKLDKLKQALEANPAIDIIHLAIGGNDFLSFARERDLAAMKPAERQLKWAAVRKDIQAVVDFILALRPGLRVVIADYDFLDPGLIAKTYKGTFHGISTKAFNEALVELGQQKLALARATPRCFYVQNWGLLQHRNGQAGRLPGRAPFYDPYPGGDPQYSSGAAMGDGVHPNQEGFQALFENAVDQFYARWLRQPPLKPVTDADVRLAPYGAAGDGKTDDTMAFQRALDDVGAAGGGTVRVPAGSYRIEGTLVVPAGTALVGIGRAPQSYSAKLPGSQLLAVDGAGKPDGMPFITLMGPNSTLEGVSVLYPDQRLEPVIPYPWTIRAGGGENNSIVNVLLANPYQAVDFGTYHSARHYVRGLYGQPLYRGIWVDQCYDIGRIQNVHFWPFWSLDQKAIDYTTKNGVMFIFQRTDWEVVDDIFVWGYLTGVELSGSRHGGMNGQMSNINLDNVDIGFDVHHTQPYVVHVSNLNIANAGAGDRHIGIWGRESPKAAELNVRGVSFWGVIHQALRWENPGTMSMSDSRVVDWTTKFPAVELLKGKTILHDVSITGTRKRTGVAVRIGPEVESGLVHDNMLNGSSLVNDGAKKVSVTNNLP